MSSVDKFNVGILGATGSVGQRFVSLLAGHPWFEVTTLGASERSQGKTYKDAVHWVLPTPIPLQYANLPIVPCDPKYFSSVDLVFSALDSSVAKTVEEEFSKADIPVFSNAKNHRTDPDVPILIPAVNDSHINVIPRQRQARGLKRGFIVTNANCSSTGLVVALKPLADAFGLKKVHVVTLQAISGAGYPGVSAYDIYGNVIPFIDGEEEKLQTEPLKILGTLKEKPSNNDQFENLNFAVSAHCNRVPVIDGHTECVSIEFIKKPTLEEVRQVLSNYHANYQKYDLPSKPPKDLVLLEEKDRPQPRLDLSNGNVVSVGRLRSCELFDVKFVLLSHNTVIGAAGGSILNAELAKVSGYLSKL